MHHDECCTGPKWRVHAHTHENASCAWFDHSHTRPKACRAPFGWGSNRQAKRCANHLGPAPDMSPFSGEHMPRAFSRWLKRVHLKKPWPILLSQKHLILHALLFIKNTKISKGFFPSRDLARSPRGGLMRERTAEVRPSPEEQSVGTGMPTRPNLDQRSPIGCSPRRRAHRTAGR